MLKLKLKKRAASSRIELDGHDISEYLTGVEVAAHIDGVSKANLYYLGPVEVEGELGRLVLRRSDYPARDRVIEATAVDDEYPK